jgi:hypothetical protein
MAPVRAPGASGEGSYLVCLDCGKRFPYDTINFRMAKVNKTPDHRAGSRA